MRDILKCVSLLGEVPQRINLQKDGNMAKAYKVKQVRNVILENNLRIEDEN